MYFKTLLVQQNKCKVQTFVICPAETQEKMCLNYKISPCLKLILNKISSIQYVNMKCTPNYTTDHTHSKKTVIYNIRGGQRRKSCGAQDGELSCKKMSRSVFMTDGLH